MPHSCNLVSLIVLFNHVTCYWFSQHRMDWSQASAYCQNRCKSHLASIHNIDDYVNAIQLINDSVAIMSEFSNRNIWIGLKYNHNSNASEWRWSDGSLFDFGHNTSGGVFPWDNNEPNSPFDCVYFNDNNAAWNDNVCSDDKLKFLCNDCEGELDKYILYKTHLNHSGATNECMVKLGTTLGSAHNYDDYLSMSQLVVTSDDDVWIGLVRESEDEWRWLDQTQFDFGTNTSGGIFPWDAQKEQPNNSGGDQDCVEQFDGRLRWNDDWCQDTHPFICNKPSELCYDYQWISFSNTSDGSDVSFNGCVANLHGNNMAFIRNKRWTDANWPLKIEYTFAVHDYAMGGNKNNVGIVISEEEDICDATFIGLNIKNLNTINAQVGERQNSIDLFSFEFNTFHRLLLLMNGSPPIVSSQLYLNDELIYHFNFSSTNRYRYIGIKNRNTNITAKTLFISGTPEYGFDGILYQCTNEPTAQPSDAPSNQPSASPSNVPYNEPSTDPTTVPSKQPSTDPTAVPSAAPTTDPTDFISSYFFVNTTFSDAYFNDEKRNKGSMAVILIGALCAVFLCVFILSYIVVIQLRKLWHESKSESPVPAVQRKNSVQSVSERVHNASKTTEIIAENPKPPIQNVNNDICEKTTEGANIINVKLMMVGSAVLTKGDIDDDNVVDIEKEESDNEDMYNVVNQVNATETGAQQSCDHEEGEKDNEDIFVVNATDTEAQQSCEEGENDNEDMYAVYATDTGTGHDLNEQNIQIQ